LNKADAAGGRTAVREDWDTGAIEVTEELVGRRVRTRSRVRALPKPSKVWASLFRTLAWLGSIVTLALVVPTITAHDLLVQGGLATAVGRLTGMLGTYLLLVTVLLVGRIPAVERALGQDTLVAWHRRLGPWVIGLLGAHALFITLGYAQGVKTGLAHELSVLVTHFPGMLGAVVGLGLIVLAGVTSYRNVRKHLRPETWWTVHLYTYLGAAVAFSHQLATGTPFLGHPLARAYWISLWLLTAGVVASYRIGLPIVRSLAHRIKVVRVEQEAPGVVSVVVRGHRLDRLPVTGGQFLTFRFLVRGMWWRGHPYSLSALPGGNEMRITVKGAGGHSSALAQIEPGTRVAIEGPYGAFTQHARETDRVLLVGAGVGATPIRAMLEDLPRRVDVVVILRASQASELILRDEIRQLVEQRGGQLYQVVGSRTQAPLDARRLQRLVPDIVSRDLYVCGPGGFMTQLADQARALGVPDGRIHHEDFAF
jgi:ferredoxin-NADP reductase